MPDDFQALSTGPQQQPGQFIPQKMTREELREYNARFDVEAALARKAAPPTPAPQGLTGPLILTAVVVLISMLLDVGSGGLGILLNIPAAFLMWRYWRKVLQPAAPAAAPSWDASPQAMPEVRRPLPQGAPYTPPAIDTAFTAQSEAASVQLAAAEPPVTPSTLKRKV